MKRARTLLHVLPSAVGGVVVPPLSNGLLTPPHPPHPPPCTARSISVSAALLRQTSRGGHSPKHRRAGSGLRELPRCRKGFSPLFLPSDERLCKDERRPPRPGVQLPRGRIRGKMSSLLCIFFSANCGEKCCTAVVGLAARCGSP